MKKVIITGGASGIGKCLVEGFHEKGYEVFTFDRVEQMHTHEHVHAYLVDLQDERAIEAGFHHIQEQFGTVDILINNAAIAQFHKPIQAITIEELDQVMDINLRAAFLCSKYFVMQKETFSYGRIINIGSIAAFTHSVSGISAGYSSTKGAVHNFTIDLAVAWAKYNITVNEVCPILTATKMMIPIFEQDPEHKKRTEANIPMGRLATPEDCVGPAVFFASDAANFVTGQYIIPDGGLSAT